jgi:hypothetical protein
MLRYLDTAIAFVVVMLGISLLITVATQMISGLLGSRGTNLRWGLETLVQTLAPKAKDNAELLVNRILHHPLISDSTFSSVARKFPLVARWKLASSIRKQELISVLRNLNEVAQDPQSTDEELKKLKTPIEQVLAAVSASPLSDIPGMITQIQALKTDAATAEKRATELVQSVRKASDEFAFWFDACMDRVSQRFTMQMRWWTVAIAIVTAFVVHLDALRLITQFWADPTERAELVTAADSMSRQAEMILGSDRTGAPALYAKAISDLKGGSFADAVKSLTPPASFPSQPEAETWLRTQLAGNPQIEAIILQYRTLVTAGLRANISDLQAEFAATKNNLERARFELVPSPYPSWKSYWTGLRPSRHFWGTLAAAALLSLGAPFWFNSLKSLTNLRPVLAQRQEAAQK